MGMNFHWFVEYDLTLCECSAKAVGDGNNFPTINIYHFPKVVLFGRMGEIFAEFKVVNTVESVDCYVSFNGMSFKFQNLHRPRLWNK